MKKFKVHKMVKRTGQDGVFVQVLVEALLWGQVPAEVEVEGGDVVGTECQQHANEW